MTLQRGLTEYIDKKLGEKSFDAYHCLVLEKDSLFPRGREIQFTLGRWIAPCVCEATDKKYLTS